MARLPARMKFFVYFLQPVPRNMRVDLGCRDIRVPEQFLDDPKINAALEQMGRERMPKGMRRNMLGDPRYFGAAFDKVMQPLPSEPRAFFREEKPV